MNFKAVKDKQTTTTTTKPVLRIPKFRSSAPSYPFGRSTLNEGCHHGSSQHLRWYTLKSELEKIAECMNRVIVYK